MSHLSNADVRLFLAGELDPTRFEATCEHLEACDDCTALCDLVSSAMTHGRRRETRWRRVVAGLLLVFLGVLAGGAAVHLRLGPFASLVGPDERRGQSLSSIKSRANWMVDDANYPAGTRYLSSVQFIHGNQQAAAALFELPDDTGLDLCGFAHDGRLLWSLRRDWQDWGDLLGRRGTRPEALRSLVTRRTSDDRREETVCLVALRHTECCVLLIDPLTGVPRGRHVYSGILGRELTNGNPITLLPGPGESRPIVLAGQSGEGETATPALLVLNPDGSPAQEIRLPSVDDASQCWARHAVVDWHGTPPTLRLDLTDHVHFLFRVEDGRLAAPRALATDTLRDTVAEEGLADFLARHAKRVRMLENPEHRRRWRDDE